MKNFKKQLFFVVFFFLQGIAKRIQLEQAIKAKKLKQTWHIAVAIKMLFPTTSLKKTLSHC